MCGNCFVEVAKFSRRRRGGVILRVERFDLCFDFFVGGGSEIFCRAKEPREGAVNCVGRACEIRVDGNSHVCAVGPVLPFFFVEQVGFGLEVADFGERQFDLPAVGGFLHRQIAPRGVGGSSSAGVGGDDFAAQRGGTAEVGAQEGADSFLARRN